MAQTRLEKIGTVYSRVVSLIKGKAMKEEDVPLWLMVYKTFPPKYEPRYDRRLPKKAIMPIYYKEDLIRAKFYKAQEFIPTTNLSKENVKSASQIFLSIYKTIEEEKLSENEIYEKALRQYTIEVKTKMLRKEETKSKT